MPNEKSTIGEMLDFLKTMQKQADGKQGTEETKTDAEKGQGQEGKKLTEAANANPNGGTKVSEAPDAKAKDPNAKADVAAGPVPAAAKSPAGVTGPSVAEDGSAEKATKPKKEGDDLDKAAAEQREKRLGYLNNLILQKAAAELQAQPAAPTASDMEKQAEAEFKALPEHMQQKIASAYAYASQCFEQYLAGALQFHQDHQLLTQKLVSEGMEQKQASETAEAFLKKAAQEDPAAFAPGAEDQAANPPESAVGDDAAAVEQVSAELAQALDASGMSAEQFVQIMATIQQLQDEGQVSDEELLAAAEQLMQQAQGVAPEKIAATVNQPRTEKIKGAIVGIFQKYAGKAPAAHAAGK